MATTLNHYRILRPLGSGGMGEVYVAEDLKLRRQVAIKILPAAVSTDPERLRRFEREALAVAALNHPNIVTIHSVEQSDQVHFLTMELVEGRALSELIAHDSLPVDRILKLAIPLADAISAAHKRGITHRDLKPANIMVSDDGRVKVLDFGLAKLKEGEPADDAVTAMPTSPITGDGRILGTVAYMSPEQAEGKPIDHRSDIFSLGVTLYEIATGERPFTGDSTVSVLSSILRDTPPAVTQVNHALPRDFARIVRRCLMKDPEQRYQSAADLRNDLEELRQALESGEITPSAMPSTNVARGRPRLLVAGLLATAIVAIGAFALLRSRGGPGAPTAPAFHATFAQLTAQPGIERFPSLAPDGKWVIYTGDASGNTDIYLQSTGGQTAINLTKDSKDADTTPAFSPDGEQIVFHSERDGGGIFVMGRTGESVRRITTAGFNPAWSPAGDEIAFGTQQIIDHPSRRAGNSALWIVNVSTGAKRQVAEGDAVQPHWSPNGHRIAYWTARGAQRQRDIATVPAGGGAAILVTDDAALDWNPVWSPDGHYLYFSSERGGSMNLWRVAIDERSGQVLGGPEPITTPSRFAGHISFSSDGRRLAFAAMEFEQNIERIAFDAASQSLKGDPTPVTSGSKLWQYIDVSPDGQWIVLASDRPQEDIFVARADGSGLRQLTNDVAFDRFPQWSPDGKRIAFQSNRNGSWEAWAINPDGSGLAQLTRNMGAHSPIWSPDGLRIAVSEYVRVNRVSIVDVRNSSQNGKPDMLPVLEGSRNWIASSWSPDGRWLAGTLIGGGIVIYSLDTREYAKLTDVGGTPLWLNDSRWLLFNSGGSTSLLDSRSKEVREMRPALPRGLGVSALSRDNRQLYLFRTSQQADVWVATLK